MTREVFIAVDEESPLVDGPWLVLPLEHDVHVLHVPTVTRHELDRGCWCMPHLESNGGTALIVAHRGPNPEACC